MPSPPCGADALLTNTVRPSIGFFRERNEITHFRFLAHISPTERRATSAALDQLDCIVTASVVDVRDDNKGASAGEACSNRPTAATTAGPCNDYNTTLVSHSAIMVQH